MEFLNDPRTQLLLIGVLIGFVHWICVEDILAKWQEGEWWGLFKQVLVISLLAYLTYQGFIQPIRERRQGLPQTTTRVVR